MAGVVVGHPLDTVKVHLQTQSSRNPIYKGILHCGFALYKENGMRSLFRGILSPMTGVGLVNAVVFSIYGTTQRQFAEPDSLYSHGVAGCIAGFAQSFICSPIELIKLRLQLQHGSDKCSTYQCFLSILRREKLRGIYRGLLTTIYRDVPAFASYFVCYEWIMKISETPTAWHSFYAGGFAGMASWAFCYPTDVIKSCIQADGMHGTFKYNGILDCIKKNYINDGLHFFFRGFNSTIIRAFPVNAACFSIVALFMRVFKGKDVDAVSGVQEPITLMCLDRHNDLAYDMQRKRALMRSSMRAFDVFHEALCHSDEDDIVNDFYPEYSKYFRTLDGQFKV